MAPPRPYWKGYLKLSLVTCPVSMMPATSESEKVRFHTLNRKTNNRLVSRYVDAETGKEVDEEDEVKGYERAEGDFLVIEDEELESVALESARTIDIEKFVPRNTIEWIWLEKPHYLSPSDEVGHGFEHLIAVRGVDENTVAFPHPEFVDEGVCHAWNSPITGTRRSIPAGGISATSPMRSTISMRSAST